MRSQQGFGLIMYAVAALAILATLAAITYRIYQAGADSVRLEWAEANRLQREAEAKKANEAATKLEVRNAKAKVIYRDRVRTVDKEVEKVVYRDTCLPPSGVCLANAAIRGESPASCKPSPAVPAPTALDGRGGLYSLALDHGRWGVLSGVR